MTLQPPILDDRSFEDLRDELVARIPAFTPEWTDHHPSDPGITLIELFAFLGEQLLFRFNQIPDTTKLAFLELLDIPVRPATAARGLVRFETDVAGGVLVERGSRVLAGDIAFQTESEVRAWPIEARAAIRARFDETTKLDPISQDHLSRARAAIDKSKQPAKYQTQFGAHMSMPGANSLDPGTSIDNTIYLALTSDTPDLTAMADGLITIGVAPTNEAPPMIERRPCPGDPAANLPDRGAATLFPMQWQISTTRVPEKPPPGKENDPIWLDLDVVGDTTRGLTEVGSIRLRMPTSLADVGVYVPADPDATGGGDQPPLVEDDEIASRLVAWIRVFRPNGSSLPEVDWIGTNTVMVEQTLPASFELLWTGSGEPNQTYRLVNRNVIGEVEIEVDEGGAGRWIPWTEVGSHRGSDYSDRHFSIDREAGTITCGDGRRGRVWQIGERVRARSYRYGGGSLGNVSPESMTAVPGTPRVIASNPTPTRGGADVESLPDAMARIPEEFRRRDRAVTVSDFRELAESAPGVGVGRAETLALFHPKRPNETVPGAVSIVVWPRIDPKRPSAPTPDTTMLDAVCRHLDVRRLVTTEVHVIAPTYREIAVSIGVHVKPSYGIGAVRRWVEVILRQYLSPLPPFGPEGRGWPLGRDVFAPELEAVALQVEGIDYLEELRLAQRTPGGSWVEPATRRIGLERWEVPALVELTVVGGNALQPGTTIQPEAATDEVAIPVRRPRTVC